MKKEIKKYSYPSRIPIKNRHWPDNIITKSPTWCSVDLRDGNQALPIPMTPERKISYFKMLCSIGFKEIEIGFPSASQDDYDFTRLLIEKKKIPDDIRISVLTQAREHLVAKTVQALKGVKEAILHCYVAASDLHAQLVFNKKREEVMEMSVKGTELVIKYLEAENMLKNISYEFSPEEFTDSDLDFVISLSEAVYETWRSKSKKQFILNLPATVERRPPYQYADMIEYFISKYKYSKDTIISVHAHNDQGCAVAATEMALLAGAQRVEGTLFGHGERTGNVDIVTLSLNLHSRGINTGLNFKNMNSIVKVVEESSGIPVHPRHPYAGSLVFTAFSGSHQDAIRKGLAQKEKAREIFGISWKIPYLHIDPADIGRKYEKIIRINSQSGKGGAVFVLENDFGYRPPKEMHPEIGNVIQKLADKKKTEISAEEVEAEFKKTFFNIDYPLKLISFHSSSSFDQKNVIANVKFSLKNELFSEKAEGNGPVSAVVHALKQIGKIYEFSIEDFSEQALGRTAEATAIAYVSVRRSSDNKIIFGAGEHSNIEYAAILALFSAVNRGWKE
ncbi:MAG TPA: 2-isopropylmalate synthase [Victivallales bacterium]|nr:2-isopropylmalate synthase [Victivallales bacterium]HPO90082.1 2-isopropylmalate synthase [Victivallales bacterium]HRR05923.1 2-isopropylmalate synthase [Victivallales bacterium]HRU00405.1 2-isopropylmalate synthase [Victivallales bacterium]